MGGRVAFEVVRLAPQRITRLALLNTADHPLPPGEAGVTEKAGRLALLALARGEGMRVMGRRWATPMVHPNQIGTPMFESLLDMIERSTPDIYAAQINALLTRPDAGPLLRTITCPTLLLCGREDVWNPPSRHQAMRNAIPGSQLGVLEQCGHMCTLEQPEPVSNALADWLSRSV
jgi:pimeloyl-ACP methyl ester carboxylesterase